MTGAALLRRGTLAVATAGLAGACSAPAEPGPPPPTRDEQRALAEAAAMIPAGERPPPPAAAEKNDAR